MQDIAAGMGFKDTANGLTQAAVQNEEQTDSQADQNSDQQVGKDDREQRDDNCLVDTSDAADEFTCTSVVARQFEQ